MNSDNYLRKIKARNVSDFNRARIQSHEMKLRGSESASVSRELSTSGTDQWNTTNQEFYQPINLNNLHKRNFKRKTPFTQWSNAYFGNGVFFNPPVQGI